ncbi:MAG: hypothetical protein NZ651_05280 [Candidatus Bipolaricaulota bacterium]|nr:hypothetical protein [Candidatus Bipolaricaulota bacterium]MDW8127165.1 hypothetical protein [Candidatus Bipolaricaulota bacterium]
MADNLSALWWAPSLTLSQALSLRDKAGSSWALTQAQRTILNNPIYTHVVEASYQLVGRWSP